MEKLTRRGFLQQTSVGVTATGMLVAAPHLAGSSTASETAAAEHTPTTPTEPMFAHVRNTSTGEIAVLVGTREIIYRDPAFVARLLKAVQ